MLKIVKIFSFREFKTENSVKSKKSVCFIVQFFPTIYCFLLSKIIWGDKMKNKNKKAGHSSDPYNLENISDFLYDNYTVSSLNECTGLIPANPTSEKKRENYKEIYDIN